MRISAKYPAALAAALIFGTAACGSSGGDKVPSDPNQASGDVTMWIYPIDPTNEAAYWKPKVAEFEKKYSKVHVKVVVQPWANRDEQLTTAIAGGKGPDVVYLIPDQLPQYASNGSLADVSDVIAKEKGDFRPNALDAMTYDKKLYGVPLLMSATTLTVNKKAMRAAGISQPPKTWDDVLADAPKLKSAGYYTTEYDGSPDETLNGTFYPLLWEAGGDVLTKDGKHAAFNSQAGVDALTFVKKLVDGGYVPKDPLTTTPKAETSPTAQGKVAFLFSGGVAGLPTTMPQSDWAIYPPLKDKVSVGYGTVGGLSVLDGSKNKSAAKAWVQWATSAAQMKVYDKTHSYYATRNSAGTLFTGNTLNAAEEKTLPNMTVGSINLKSRQLMDLIKPHIQAVLLGKTSPKKALDAAAKDVNGLLARG
jgi:multiple sugar transport system substrate-binding protein